MAVRGLLLLLGCLATAALLTSAAMAEGDDQGCTDGWTKFDSRCFKFFDELMTWTDAEKSCVSEDAHLASVHSSEENAFIGIMIRQAKGSDNYVWLGGTDAIQEAVWMWIDGSAWDFTNWRPGEPNNYGGSHNLLFYGVSWYDGPYSNKQYYVCAKNVSPPSTPVPKTVSLTLEGFLCQCTPQKK